MINLKKPQRFPSGPVILFTYLCTNQQFRLISFDFDNLDLLTPTLSCPLSLVHSGQFRHSEAKELSSSE